MSVDSIYYAGVQEAIQKHLLRGGKAYVIMHTADHSGHTWGDEAYVTVGEKITTLDTGSAGQTYIHESMPYA